MVEVQVGEQAELEIEYDTPVGTPESERVTASLEPEVRVLVIVFCVKTSALPLVALDVPELERE